MTTFTAPHHTHLDTPGQPKPRLRDDPALALTRLRDDPALPLMLPTAATSLATPRPARTGSTSPPWPAPPTTTLRASPVLTCLTDLDRPGQTITTHRFASYPAKSAHN